MSDTRTLHRALEQMRTEQDRRQCDTQRLLLRTKTDIVESHSKLEEHMENLLQRRIAGCGDNNDPQVLSTPAVLEQLPGPTHVQLSVSQVTAINESGKKICKISVCFSFFYLSHC